MSETQYYPLTSGQMILMFSQKYSIKKQINNVCATIAIETDVEEELLMQAIYMAFMRYPALNCRFTMQGEQMVQYFTNHTPENIEIVDFQNKSKESMQKQIDEWSSTPFPNKCLNTCLYRLRILRMPNHKYSLYVCVYHLIMDAYALMGCIKYIETVYDCLLNHKPIPEVPNRILECYQKDYDYFKSERHAKDMEFWKKEFETEPQFTTVNGLQSKENVKGKRYGVGLRLWQVGGDHINLRIPKELVSAVNEKALQYHISPQCFYLLAVRSYLSKVCETCDVSIMNTVARRSTVIQKHAGGTMVNAIPLRCVFDNNTTFKEAIQLVFKKQREIYRHSDVSFGEISELITKSFNLKQGLQSVGYQSVSLTFQPFFFTDENSVLKYSFKREKNGASTMPLYMSIMPYDDSGDLWVNYEFIVNYVKPESIHNLHAFMLKFLEEGVQDDQATLDTLMKKTNA